MHSRLWDIWVYHSKKGLTTIKNIQKKIQLVVSQSVWNIRSLKRINQLSYD